MTAPFEVFWTDGRGAGRSRNFGTAADVVAFLRGLRRPTIVRDARGEVVGGIAPCDHADDQRIRWQWWMESAAGEAAVRS